MIYPRNNQGFWSLNPKDQEQFVNLINDKNVDIIGIGNRTGFREMERIVVELIQKNMFYCYYSMICNRYVCTDDNKINIHSKTCLLIFWIDLILL